MCARRCVCVRMCVCVCACACVLCVCVFTRVVVLLTLKPLTLGESYLLSVGGGRGRWAGEEVEEVDPMFMG